MKKVALIPIDNRPICYDLIYDILSIDKNIKLFMPDLSDLGGLYTKSNVENILDFIKNLDEIDYLIVSLDTLAYGGLVPSRRTNDDFCVIKERMEEFKKTAAQKKCKILAFSSIMRISNNNINEEEKEYWAQWGKRIFDWSYYLHKSEVEKSYNCVLNKVPEDILEDYLNTRKRNFEINKMYLNWASEGFFDTLIFSKDDCAQFGLNVKEALELSEIIKRDKISCAKIKTGADEIPLSLLARALSENEKIKINPVFLKAESKNLISKYEDISIDSCTNAQIELAGAIADEKNPDLTLFINNFENEQGDLVLGDLINQNREKIDFPSLSYFIADVNNANGADFEFVENFLQKKYDDNFYGYCGYNTSANTLGCAILAATVKFLSKKNSSFDENAFKKLQFIRFLDDWGYQAISRGYVRENAPDFKKALKAKEHELSICARKISGFLEYFPTKISYSLPWDRSFEIRITVE